MKFESVVVDCLSESWPQSECLDPLVRGYLAAAMCGGGEDVVALTRPHWLDAGEEDESLRLMVDAWRRKCEEKGISVASTEREELELLDEEATLGENEEQLRADMQRAGVELAAGDVSRVDSERLEALNTRQQKRKQQRQEKQDAKRSQASLRALAEMQAQHARHTGAHATLQRGKAGARPTSADLRLEHFGLQAGGSVLLRDATMTLARNRRYGLVGHNGVGKTTLLRAIAGRELPIPAGMSVLHVQQEEHLATADGEAALTALNCVLAADGDRLALLEQLEGATNRGDGGRIDQIMAQLEEIDAYTAESRAASILSGLGFDEAMQDSAVSSFSGGWRMRIALARALFATPDILMLDEPTNHLDLYAVLWLERYLTEQWTNGTLIVVSHSREFLNAVATDIVHLQAGKLDQYKGNYDSFERTRAERARQSVRASAAVARQRAHIQKFVDKFRFNANRATMVQSRIKTLNKLADSGDEGREDPSIQFSFSAPVAKLSPPLLQLDRVGYRYEGAEQVTLKNVSLSVDMDSRIALVGPNGGGKSTLLKMLCGELEPNASESGGMAHRNAKLRFGVFAQHFVDQLHLGETAVEHYRRTHPDASPQDARAAVGRFGVMGEQAIRPMMTLSGGQKSRVVLATIAATKPSMLLLDEPSNHLDLDSVEALALSLASFEGGVLLVSHDEHLINLVCDEIWIVDDQTVEKFDGTFAQYKRRLMREVGAF